MPRTTWIRLLVVLIALPLASCLDRDEECLTCPSENSASIDVVVARFGDIDSVHVRVDGGTRVTVKRDKRTSFEGLASGDHAIQVVRWYQNQGIVTSKTSDFTIRLEAGETRVILLHNDFPLVTQDFPPMRAPAPEASHPGWDRA